MMLCFSDLQCTWQYEFLQTPWVLPAVGFGYTSLLPCILFRCRQRNCSYWPSPQHPDYACYCR